MYARYPPIERVPGRSAAGWFSGFVAGGVAMALVWAWVLYTVGGSFGNVPTPRDYESLAQLQGLSNVLIILYIFVWWALVPMPLGAAEISPLGVTVKFGLRTESFPWGRVHLVDSRLHTVGRWLGLTNRYSLTPYQVSRIQRFLDPHPTIG
jgi:hypothetical protein